MAGFANGIKVFKTTNGGTSWTNISFNLPNVPVNCIKYIPSGNKLMVACDVGVYVLNSGASSWTSYSQGLPNVIVSDIEFNPSLNKVYISTFGRGIWETNLSILTGIQEQSSKNILEYAVYPSVNNGNFTVQIIAVNPDSELTIYDVSGKIIHAGLLKENETNFSLSVLPGIYFIKVESNGRMGVKKIIVE
jgi:hypothetical protein